MRKEPLKNSFLYHICTKSIAGYVIFRSNEDYSRMMEMMRYYRMLKPPMRYSLYEKLLASGTLSHIFDYSEDNLLVDIVGYCLMPTHIHLILCQLKDNGISVYMKKILDSYSRYFNIKRDRRGPLWQGRFKSVLIETDEQLLHLTRYIHLNPTSGNIVEHPENWPYSSYGEYINSPSNKLCNHIKYIRLASDQYKTFVESRQDYQRGLEEIKHIILE